MNTVIRKVDPCNPEPDVIDQAAQILQSGGLVAFPTETVYGLGAYAFDATAAKRIYEAKGRPADNPLIVHVASYEQLSDVVDRLDPMAQTLMSAFWPGPFTLILPKNKRLPYEITSGLDTVAVRWPSHPVAVRLIQQAGAIAAPSGNLSGKPSPTTGQHIIHDMSGKIDMILDGGSSDFGLESTILDITTGKATLLRPGSITKEQIEQRIGSIETETTSDRPKAPGMKYTHYSPNAKLTIVTGDAEDVCRSILQLVRPQQIKTAILATEQTKNHYTVPHVKVISMGDRNDPDTIAARLFGALRELDLEGIEEAYAEGLDENGIGLAIMNRMKKAAGYQIIESKKRGG